MAEQQTHEQLVVKIAELESQLQSAQVLAGKAQTLIDAVAPLFAAGLYSRFHHGQGYLCAGTLRVMRADFDTQPSQAFQDAFFEQVCGSMNGLTAFLPERPDPFAWMTDLSESELV